MIEPWQKEVNLQWIGQIKSTLQEGGKWIWPSAGFMYTIKNGELVGENKDANEALKAILP